MTTNSMRRLFSCNRSTAIRTKPMSALRIESLEMRAMLTTIFVDADADIGGDGSAGHPFNEIQLGIVAAAESPGPDSIKISPAVYEENLTIEDSGKLTIHGNGATVASPVGDDEHTIKIDDSSDVTIRDLIVIDGDDGIRADNVGNLTLIHVTATGNDDEGVQADNIGNLILVKVTATGNDGRGVDAGDIGMARVVDAMFSDNDSDGLRVVGADELQVIGGTFNNNSDGMDLEVIGAVKVTNASADNNEDEGLEVDDVGSIWVAGGLYTNNGEAGLDIDDTVHIRIVNVVSTGNNEHGLQIEAEDDGDEFTTIESLSITNSVFSDNTGDGIQITEAENTLVRTVTITNVDVIHNLEGYNEDDMEYYGGHGLFIDISGDLQLRNVLSIDNTYPDVLP